MTITKHNYEEFFLLYVDNELSIEERKAVEDFVKVNPGLSEELDALMQTQLQAPKLSFDKSRLYKPEQAVNDEMLMCYIDNELDEAGRNMVEQSAANDEAVARELILLKRTVLQPEIILFENKEVLYRRATAVVSIVTWRRLLAAAASVLLVGGLMWVARTAVQSTTSTEIARVDAPVHTPAIEDNPSLPSIPDQDPPASTPSTSTVENRLATERNADNTIAAVKPAGTRHTTVHSEARRIPQTRQTAIPALSKENHDVPIEGVDNSSLAGIDVAVPAIITPREAIVQPLILTEEDFRGEEKEMLTAVEPGMISPEEIDNKANKLNGNIRGFFRKTSRFINRSKVTQPDAEELTDQSVVRIASFAIAKK